MVPDLGNLRLGRYLLLIGGLLLVQPLAPLALANLRSVSPNQRVAICVGTVIGACVALLTLRLMVNRVGARTRALASRLSEAEERCARHEADMQQLTSDLLIGLARRNQALLHQQLTRIHDMNACLQNPTLLNQLAAIDHLGIRMRRNAESLVILSGRASARKLARSAPMSEAIRLAIAETEDFARMDVTLRGDVDLLGRVVADVVHLLAELLENAATFSSPKTRVMVRGTPGPQGYVITIVDHGTGFSAENLAEKNRLFSAPVTKSTTFNEMLGFLVVRRLAERHDIAVRLASQPRRGTMVTVEFPQSMFVLHAPDEARPAAPDQPRLVEFPMHPRQYVPEYPAEK